MMVKLSLMLTSAIVAALFFNFEATARAEAVSEPHSVLEDPIKSDLEIGNYDDAKVLKEKFLQTGDDLYLDNLISLANANNAEASIVLGDFYSRGQLPLNGELAVEYYVKALMAGAKSQHLRLGEIYKQGRIVKKDIEKANYHLQMAYDHGSPLAAVLLGSSYANGDLGKTDLQLGISMLEKQAESGNALALLSLGDIYSRDGDNLNGELAASYYEKAANIGNNSAMHKLGELYRKGSIVPKDENKAKLYLSKASESGNVGAQIRLAGLLIAEASSLEDRSRGIDILEILTESGDKTAPILLGDFYSSDAANFDKAVNFYEKAARTGNNYGFIKLARAYRDGTIVASNSEKAIAYFHSAAENGDASALRMLASDHLNKRFGTLSNPRSAVALLEKAIAAGDNKSFSSLASVYLNGLGGIKKDPKKAIDMLVTGAKLGDPSSTKSLVNIYRNGRGKEVPKNLTKAEQALALYGAALSDDDKVYEKNLLSASRATSIQEFKSIFDSINALPSSKQIQFVNNIRSANGNAYTFVIQSALNQKGIYKGKINGYMNSGTIRSINEYCRSVGISTQCVQGPLHWTTSMAVSENLFSNN